MLDIRKIRENPDSVKSALKARGKIWDKDIDRILELDAKIHTLRRKIDEATIQKNKITKDNGKLFGLKKGLEKKGQDATEVETKIAANICASIQIDEEKADDQKILNTLQMEYQDLMMCLPNIPDRDLPQGYDKEEIIRSAGEIPSFDFLPRTYFELYEKQNMIRFSEDCSISGLSSWLYSGIGARLAWAVMSYCIERSDSIGYTLVETEHILREECRRITGRISEEEKDLLGNRFKIQYDSWDGGRYYLMSDAEDAMAVLHKDCILTEEDLPKKYITCTNCYGRYYHRNQTAKVEMIQFTKPEESDKAFQEIVKDTESLLEGLGLNFRTVKLPTEKCHWNKSRTYRIETRNPSSNRYNELAMISHARDYQARRGNVRYHRADGKIDFVHTLNSTGLEITSIMQAIVEQNQRADGSIVVPEVLRKYLGGIEIISK